MKSFIENIFRFLFAWIDSLVAWLIKILYDLFYEVSNVMLYSEDVISSIGQRIALLLGIFMLFRLAISLINYLISPDKLNDKSTGGGKILLNIIISLTLLATVNIIFVQAYKIQKIIIDSNIIEKIFFGTQANSTDGLADTDAGYYLYTGLLKPNDEIFEGKCSSLWDIGQYLSGSECADVANNVLQDDIMTVYEARNNRDISIALKNYDLITKRSANHGDKYVFDYYPIISTIAGITAALMLISFTMDLATRAVKLLFLQIIAPIPIISNMDPNKGKNVFEKWYKECFSTYISLFIRIIVINFVSYMIILVTSNFKDIFASNPYLNVLIILGCLMFAKQLPKLIEDLFGIKSSGNMTLNPMKKIQEQALFGSQIAGAGRGALAGAIGLGAGSIGGLVASAALGNSFLQTTGAALRGGFRGATGGFVGGYKSKDTMGSIKSGFGHYKANAEYVNMLVGTDFIGRSKAGIQQRFNIATDADKKKKEIEQLNSFDQATNSALKRAEAESIKYNDLKLDDGTTMANHKAQQEQLTRLRNTELDKSQFYDSEGNFDSNAYSAAAQNRDKTIAELQDKIAINQKKFATEYITQVSKGDLKRKIRDAHGNVISEEVVKDGELANYINQIKHHQEELAKKGHKYVITDSDGNINGEKIKAAKQAATEDRQSIEQNYNDKGINVYQQQQANAAASKPKGK